MIKENDVIGYYPDLDISPKPKSGYIDPGYNITTSNKYGSTYKDKKTLDSEMNNKTILSRQFEYNLPSIKLDYIQKCIDKSIKVNKELEKKIESNIYAGKYFSTEEQEVLKKNSNDLENGSTELEIYDFLNSILIELKSILKLYSECVYGKNLSFEDYKEMDNQNLSAIKNLESKGDFSKINYFSLYYEVQISHILGEYANDVYVIIAKLEDILAIEKQHANTNSTVRDMLKKSFDKNNILLNDDLYKEKDINEKLLTSINNFYLESQKINSFLNEFSNLYKDKNAQVIEGIRQENINELNEKIDNLVKNVMYSKVAKEDICNTLSKKFMYRAIIQ